MCICFGAVYMLFLYDRFITDYSCLITHHPDHIAHLRSPDTAKIKQKMIYAASKDGLRKKLDGVYTEIQCTDLAEVSHETVLDKVNENLL
jgi:hypothetical protein